jgi:phage tail sheath protein FI
MPTYIAPGIYTQTIDNSQYAAPVSLTTCGIVGAATQGPVLGSYDAANNTFVEPILITTQAEFIGTFGSPSPEFQGPYAAMLYLVNGQQLFYGRVVGSGSDTATIVLDNLTISALSPGAFGNNISVSITNSYVAGTDAEGPKLLTVYNTVGGVMMTEESWDGLVTDDSSDQFYETVINGSSQFISVTWTDPTQTSQPANTLGDNPSVGIMEYLAGGADGDPPTDDDIIGAVYSGYQTGLWAYSDTDNIDVSLLCAPGYSSPEVCEALLEVVEMRGDCLGLLHGPQGLNAQEIVDWHNAAAEFTAGGDTPSVLIASSHMALYWPWVQIYDNYNAQNVWVPPVGMALQAIAYNDQVGEAWYAPAGINRGQCTGALALEYRPTLGDREFIYGPGNGNAVNPLVDLPLDGITIYGQRTMQRFPSALDRINVQRLIFYCVKVLTAACRTLVFEQDDQILWSQFINIVSPFMQNIQSRRGVEQYLVICDETTNTPFDRNNNEMYGVIMLIPTKVAEKIIIQFNINASGVQLTAPQIG